MNQQLHNPVERLIRTLMYEGYRLYPYRANALKNQRPWMFGCLFPPDYCQRTGRADASSLQMECLVKAPMPPTLRITLHFLQLLDNDREEVIERTVDVGRSTTFSCAPVQGECLVDVQAVSEGVQKVRVCVENRVTCCPTAARDRAAMLPWAMLSCHVLATVHEGSFVSLIDPPEALRSPAQACRNVGVWPVLVGDPERHDTLLAAPIILPDYPQVAAESPGDLFDATEIDELLSLRILTLSDEEKAALAHTNSAVRSLLERTEELSPAQLLRLHGRQQAVKGLRPGLRVRLRPRGRSDIFDLALEGMTAVVVAVDQDFEGQVYARVAVDDDPGRDLGHAGRPGHSFYFRADEVESLGDE